MRLLIITQAVDRADPVLGFFHRWLESLATRFEQIHVICLKAGEHALPGNVRVHSLGKERGVTRFGYVRQFFHLIWSLRAEYDAVFVHMNQEYVLLGGLFWRVRGTPVHFWRNHVSGSLLTRLAVAFSSRVYCTSPFSYTARFSKTQIMPVGIDMQVFQSATTPATDASILFLSRLDEVKQPHILIAALARLHAAGMQFCCTIAGAPTYPDSSYYRSLVASVSDARLESIVRFVGAVSHARAAELYRQHDIYVNCTNSGSFDKTILEAAASGCVVLVSNQTLRGKIPDECIFKEGDADACASKLSALLSLSEAEKSNYATLLRAYVEREHSLTRLVEELTANLEQTRHVGLHS